MNKAQLVEELASRFDGNKKVAAHALESVLDVITRTVVTGEKVAISGFGAFEKVERAARFARNPATGDRVRVKKTSVPRFRPGSELKAVVSGAKKLPKAAVAGSKAATTRRSAATAAAPAKATTTRKTAAKKTAEKTAPSKRAAAAKTTKSAAAKTTTTRKTAAKKTTTAKKASATKAPAKKATTRRSTRKA